MKETGYTSIICYGEETCYRAPLDQYEAIRGRWLIARRQHKGLGEVDFETLDGAKITLLGRDIGVVSELSAAALAAIAERQRVAAIEEMTS